MEPVGAGKRIEMAAALGKESSPKDGVPVFVKVRLAPGHHIYALGDSGSSNNQPTSMDAKLPPGMSLAGPWRGPEPKKMSNGSRVYEKEVVLWNLIKTGAIPTQGKIELKLSFQVCNELLCWPPETISREITLEQGAAGK